MSYKVIVAKLSDGAGGRTKASTPDNITLIVDPLVPKEFYPMFAVHEATEAKEMENGKSYTAAHKIATEAERKYCQDNNINFDEYNTKYEEILTKVRNRNPLPKDPSNLFEGEEGEVQKGDDTIPIQSCTLPEGGKGFKYGNSGKCYANRSDAEAQAAAIHANGFVEKAYPNFHSARVEDPSKFTEGSFRNKTLPKSEGGKGGVQIIMGKKPGSDSMEVQAYRFPVDKYTAAEAREWLATNKVKGYKFEESSGDVKKISTPSDSSVALFFMQEETDAADEYEMTVPYVDCPNLQRILSEHAADEHEHFDELEAWLRTMDPAAYEANTSDVMKGETHSRQYLDAFHKHIMSNTAIDPDFKEAAHKVARATAGGMMKKPKTPETQPMPPMGEIVNVEDCMKSYVIEIAKMTDNVVYGVVLAPNKADLQGDVMSKEDIEKASHEYMKEYRTINIDHKDNVDAYPVESWIAKEDGMLGTRPYTKGSWLMGTLLPQDLADKVRSGKYRSYSIEGTGVREPLKK